jgi:iron complex outermembrane receptor protein
MKIIIYCFLLFAGYNSLYAQECNFRVEGIVTDKHDGNPIPSAKIYIKGSSLFAETDSNGHYSIEGICDPIIQLICFHHIGCEPERKEIILNENTIVDFSIEYHLLELDETLITYYVLDESPISVVKMSEIDKLNGAGKTLGEQLTQLPGVQTLSTGSSISKPVIHGMHSNRVVLMNNGVRQEGQQWGSEHAPEIDPFLSTEMSVVKGASAVKYGPEALAGVLLINPAPWKSDIGWNGDVMMGIYSNGRQGFGSVKLENKSKRVEGLYFRAHGTLKKSGNVSAPNYYLGNTGFEEYNFSIASKYERNKNSFELYYSQFNTNLGIFSGSHIGNLSDLQAAFEAKEPLIKSDFTYSIVSPKQSISHGLFKASYNRAWNEKQQSELNYSRQTNDRSEFDVDKGYGVQKDENTPDFRLLLTTHSVDFVHKSKWGKLLETQVGTQLTYQKNARAGRFLVPNFFKYMGGLYGIANVHKDAWDFEGGVRWDYVRLDAFYYEGDSLVSPIKNYGNTSATIGLTRSFGHHLALKFNLGTAWRPPSISELYSNGLHHGAAAIEVGNSNLGKEQSNSIQFGVQYKSKRLSTYVDLYHMYFTNYIYLRPNGVELTIKGAFPSFVYESIKAQYSGMDISLDYYFTKWVSYQGKFNMVRAFNLSDRSYMIGVPADRIRNGLVFSFEDQKLRELKFTISTDYVFKQTRFVEGVDYVDPPVDYLLLNMAVNYEFKMKENTVQLAMTIDNLLNKTYRDYMNRFRYFTDERGRNLGLKIYYKF